MHSRSFNPNTAPLADLVVEVLRLRADLALISSELVRESNLRGWCSDYDQWARVMNKKLSRPWFIDRTDLHHQGTVASAHWTEHAVDPTAEPITAHDPQPIIAGSRVWCSICGTYHDIAPPDDVPASPA